MTDTPVFSSLLDEAPTEISVPLPLPVGTYLCVVGQFEKTKPSKAGNEGIKFSLRPIAPMDDVDAELLNEVGGLDGKNLSTTFWLTPDAIYRLDEFHQNCGIDISEPAPRRIRNQEVVNSQVLAVVSHRESDDHTRTYAQVDRTAPAE